jgi:hypothetical protein
LPVKRITIINVARALTDGMASIVPVPRRL